MFNLFKKKKQATCHPITKKITLKINYKNIDGQVEGYELSRNYFTVEEFKEAKERYSKALAEIYNLLQKDCHYLQINDSIILRKCDFINCAIIWNNDFKD